MTPKETTLAIEAAIWHDERAQKRAMSQAWYTAALRRQKRIPGLKQFLMMAFPPRVTQEENEKRKRDYVEMTEELDVADLGQKIARRKRKT